MSHILVVDDEPSICWGLARLGAKMGHVVRTAGSAEEGLRMARDQRPDLLILDVRLPGLDGLTALQEFQEVGKFPTIVITAFGALDTAVRAVRCGAWDYLIKPFDLAEIRSAIDRVLRSAAEVQVTAPAEVVDEIVGSTPAMQQLFKQLALAADANANILLLGESGVGKELVARAIHRYSRRAGSRFVPVNVAALSPTLIESELFGHVDGAFTGAHRARDGLLVQARGGTLFLDEVAEIPGPIQVKLLRALEEGEILPVGADRSVTADFRVVAATHQDLANLVQQGLFRHDLYFRLCAYEIEIPPLRERLADIPRLAAHFAAKIGRGSLQLTEATLAEMQCRPWYGNVRELRNAIEHASVVARAGTVLPEHLPPPQPRFSDPEPIRRGRIPDLAEASAARSRELLHDPHADGNIYEQIMREVEGPMLRNAMEFFGDECAPAARALGLHRTTLRKKLVQHNLHPSTAEPPPDDAHPSTP